LGAKLGYLDQEGRFKKLENPIIKGHKGGGLKKKKSGPIERL